MEGPTGVPTSQRRSKVIGEVFLIVIGAVLFGYCFFSISQERLTPTESSLFAIVLTIASLMVSWLISRIYSRQSIDASVRDNAVQIGNAVSGIKTQLRSLSEWSMVQRTRAVCQDGQTEAVLDHITQMLSAIDCQIDTTLKGIGGSIGDSDRQHTLLLRQIGDLVEQRIEAVSITSNASTDADEYRRHEKIIARLDEQIGSLSQLLSEQEPATVASSINESTHTITCPYCKRTQDGSILNIAGQTKIVGCIRCRRRFNIHSDGRYVFSRPTFYEDGLEDDVNAQRDALSPTGFAFSPTEFKFLADAILSTYAPSQFSLTSLVEEILHAGVLPAMSKTRVRRFLQLLYWGRLFEFGPSQTENVTEDTPAIMINEITREELISAFCRSVGYRMADTSFDNAMSTIETHIERYFKVAAPDSNIAELAVAYHSGRSQALSHSVPAAT